MIKGHGLQGAALGAMDLTIGMLGTIIGLAAATSSTEITFMGLVIVGIAHSLSTAAGMHVSEEAENIHTHKEVMESTFLTFLAGICVVILLAIPLTLLEMPISLYASTMVAIGIFISLGIVGNIAQKKKGPWLIIEYTAIGLGVAAVSYLIGLLL